MGYYCPGGTGVSNVQPVQCPGNQSTASGVAGASTADCRACPAGSTVYQYVKAPRWRDMYGNSQGSRVCLNCSTGWCGMVSV